MLRILPPRECKAVVQPMVNAFWDDPETVHLLPDENDRKHVLPRYLLSDARDAARFDMLLAAEVDGAIVGAAAWIPPEAYPVSATRQVFQALDLAPALPWGLSAIREASRGRIANRDRHRVLPDHFYLRAIGVEPTTQGHGFGSMLVRSALQLADHRLVGCFLQTTSRANVSWYEHLGFRIIDRYRPTPTWPDVWAMWRDPSTT